MTTAQSIQTQVDKLLQKTLDAATAQGHSNTGKLHQTATTVIAFQDLDRVVIDAMYEDYAIPLDTGVKAVNIPYTIHRRGAARRGGTSKYIQGLATYAKQKNPSLSDKEALSRAFQIANAAKSENNAPFGHPTQGSMKYTTTGSRIGFISDTVTDAANVQQLVDDISAALMREFELMIF